MLAAFVLLDLAPALVPTSAQQGSSTYSRGRHRSAPKLSVVLLLEFAK